MYKAYITRIKNLRKHSNADRLQCGECFGNQVIVDLNTIEGQIGCYFPSDGKLGIEYATENNLLRKKNEEGNNVGGYLDPDKRNIKALSLRGEKSDGLFMPLESLSNFTNIKKLSEGDTIDVLNGIVICEKYIPIRKSSGVGAQPSTKKPKVNHFPLFAMHVDTPQLNYNLDMFGAGDIISITEKVHGTSQREAYTIKRNQLRWWQKFFKKENQSWEHVSGSRRVILTDNQTGFYGTNAFRKKWSDYFIGKLNKGEEIFFEVVGYYDVNAPIMPSGDNRKTKDKEFIKRFGIATHFSYGCESEVGENKIFIYRMTYTDEFGYTIEYPWSLVKMRTEQMGLLTVPELDTFIYSTEEDFLSRVNKWLDIPSTIDSSHVIEGVVVRKINSPTLKIAKTKSFSFKCIEGIIKQEAIQPDLEEQE